MLKRIMLISLMTCIENFTEENVWVKSVFSSRLPKFWNHRRDTKHV